MLSPVLIALGAAVGAALPSSASASAPMSAPAPTAKMAAPLYADLTIRQRMVIRVPTREDPPQRVTRWRERKGPTCLPARAIAGAQLIAPDRVDFVLTGGQRIRAKLETSCPALDFYNGFYLRPDSEDGMVCAGRDAIHARSGGECQIHKFRHLVPDR